MKHTSKDFKYWSTYRYKKWIKAGIESSNSVLYIVEKYARGQPYILWVSNSYRRQFGDRHIRFDVISSSWGDEIEYPNVIGLDDVMINKYFFIFDKEEDAKIFYHYIKILH